MLDAVVSLTKSFFQGVGNNVYLGSWDVLGIWLFWVLWDMFEITLDGSYMGS